MNDAQVVEELRRYFLGKDWCVVDPMGKDQVNEIMVEDIKRKYKSKVKLHKFKRKDGTPYAMECA